jgi:hypothetical protein
MGGNCLGCLGLEDVNEEHRTLLPRPQTMQSGPSAQLRPPVQPVLQPMPRPVVQQNLSLSRGSQSCSVVQPHPQPLPVMLLQMYLDGDRDGAVDGAPANYGDWRWGATGVVSPAPGGVIMVRTRIRPTELVRERCELRFQWDHGPEVRPGWTAVLTIDQPTRIRFYPDQTHTAAVIALNAPTIDIKARPGATAGSVSLWMEAADYGADNQEASWLVRLTYRFVDADGGVHNQDAQLRIAPWIMASDLDPTAIVFGVGASPLADYPLELSNFVTGAGVQFQRMNQINNMSESILRKPYVRDVIKGGFSRAPHYQHLVFQQNLDVQASYQIGNGRLWTIGTSGIVDRPEWASEANGSSQNNGGNLLVSPPEDDYPYGRIIYGQNNPDFMCNSAPFYRRQRMQRPIQLDSSWLKVGHVDEYLSFVPDVGGAVGPWPWKILMMDPRLGYALADAASALPNAPAGLDQICDDADALATASRNANENFAAFLLRCQQVFGATIDNLSAGPPNPVGYAASPGPPANQNGKVIRISLTAEDGSNPNTYSAMNFQAYRTAVTHDQWFNAVTGSIDADRATLLNALNKTAGDMIGIPALLGFAEAEHRFLTDTADSVNMLVIRDGNGARCLIPKPFGPVCANAYLFEHHINRKLTALGLTVTFVNNWIFLHCDDGEVHCGTNQIPDLNVMNTRPDQAAADRTWWLRAPP